MSRAFALVLLAAVAAAPSAAQPPVGQPPTAIADTMGRAGADHTPCTVTADYHVKLLRPTPTDGPVRLVARVVDSTDDRATIEAALHAGGKVCATCRGTFVAVKPGHPAYYRW